MKPTREEIELYIGCANIELGTQRDDQWVREIATKLRAWSEEDKKPISPWLEMMLLGQLSAVFVHAKTMMEAGAPRPSALETIHEAASEMLKNYPDSMVARRFMRIANDMDGNPNVQ